MNQVNSQSFFSNMSKWYWVSSIMLMVFPFPDSLRSFIGYSLISSVFFHSVNKSRCICGFCTSIAWTWDNEPCIIHVPLPYLSLSPESWSHNSTLCSGCLPETHLEVWFPKNRSAINLNLLDSQQFCSLFV